MALATLSIDLEARLAKLQSGMDAAGRLAEKNAARMSAAFGKVEAVAGGIGKALIAGLSVGAFTAFIKNTTDGLLAIKDLSEATGSAVEKISGLEDVARAAGGGIAEVEGTLIKFNMALKDAGRNKEIGGVLDALNLDVAELKRLDPADALQKTARALNEFADDGERARAVQILFGKSVKEVGPYLRELADAGDVFGEVTKAQVLEADKFNKELARLRTNAEDAARAISGPLVSAINDLVEKTRNNGLAGFFDSLNNSALGKKLGVDDLSRATRDVDRLRTAIASLERSEQRQIFPPMAAAIRDERLQLEAELRAAEARLRDIRNSEGAGQGRGSIIPPTVGQARLRLPDEDAGKKGKKEKPDFPFAITDPFAATKQSFLQAEKDYEATDNLLRQIEERSVQAAEALRKSLVDQGAATFEATRTPIERLNVELARQQALLDALGPAYRDTYERAVFAAQDAFEAASKLPDKLKETQDIAKDLGLTFSSAFEDAIVGGKKLSDVLKGLEQDILRIVTRKLVTEPLGNAITGILKPGDGGKGFDLAGIFKSLFSGFFASGGFIPPGRWGVAGEDGPEPIFGGRTGLTVQPAGGGAITVNVQMPAGADRRTGQQFGAEVARQIDRAARRGN